MGKITIELLRKRSEHNEGEIHSLEELALHQEKLEKIELLDKVCKNVKILLLQNNAISKIENVARLKNLEYLNLALNTIEKIENLEGCESLKKLDLTLNFVAELTSVKSLSTLPHLEQLYLVGNPCDNYTGYREYVIGVLPQLQSLDGRDISQTERIQASQDLDNTEKMIIRQQEKYFYEQQKQGKSSIPAKTVVESITPETSTVKRVNSPVESEEDDSDYWNQTTANTPEVRKEMIRRMEIQDEKKKPKDTRNVKPPRKLTTAEGKPLNINEAKVEFFLNDDWEQNQFVLDLAVPKHMCTTLINADVQPSHVTVTMKGKIFQLVLPEEVKPDSSSSQRSQTTGHLVITMPKVYDTQTQSWGKKENPIDLRSAKLRVKLSTSLSEPEKKTQTRNAVAFPTLGNDDVPPLI